MSAPPLLFDRPLHRRRLDRAAPRYGEADFLKVRAAEDVADRVGAIMRSFPLAVDLGARNGAFRTALQAGLKPTQVGTLIEADLSHAMLRGRPGLRLVLDEERLPFAPASLDLVVSSLALHWTNDLPGALVQIRLSLRPDGVFVGAFLGGSTLTELRQSLLQAEIDIHGGAGPRVSPFADARDAAGLLQRAGFKLPVADTDTVRVSYRDPLKLLSDLRAMGETGVLVDRPRNPLTRQVLGRAFDLYAEKFSNPDGTLRATFEIITATGWAPPEAL